jgi:hypothetical protein
MEGRAFLMESEEAILSKPFKDKMNMSFEN